MGPIGLPPNSLLGNDLNTLWRRGRRQHEVSELWTSLIIAPQRGTCLFFIPTNLRYLTLESGAENRLPFSPSSKSQPAIVFYV